MALEFYCFDCCDYFEFSDRPGAQVCFVCGGVHGVEVLGYYDDRRVNADGVFRVNGDAFGCVSLGDWCAQLTAFRRGVGRWVAGGTLERQGREVVSVAARVDSTEFPDSRTALMAGAADLVTAGRNTPAAGELEFGSLAVELQRWTPPAEVITPQLIASQGDEYRLIPILDVSYSHTNPRRQFDSAAMDRLTETVAEFGILEPLLVRRKPGQETAFELIAGERRLLAARRAGLESVPCVVKSLTDREALEVQLIENLERASLNPIEEARAFERLTMPQTDGGGGYTQAELSQKIRIGPDRHAPTPSYVCNRLRLLKLPDEWQSKVERGDLSPTQARELIPYAERPDVLGTLARLLDDLGQDEETGSPCCAADLRGGEFRALLGRAMREVSQAATAALAAVRDPSPSTTAEHGEPIDAEDFADEVAAETDPPRETDAEERCSISATSESTMEILPQKPHTAAADYVTRLAEWVRRFRDSQLRIYLKSELPSGLLAWLLLFSSLPGADHRQRKIVECLDSQRPPETPIDFLSQLPDGSSAAAMRWINCWLDDPALTDATQSDVFRLCCGSLSDVWELDQSFLDLHTTEQLICLANEWEITQPVDGWESLNRQSVLKWITAHGRDVSLPRCLQAFDLEGGT